jgi:hypothetical protein
MNLWVKRAGQLLVAALFLMSCEDDSFLLGFQNKNKKFNVRAQEFKLPGASVLVDSLVTDNRDRSSRYLVGQYQDFRFGTVRAETFTQLFPATLTKIESSSVFDSVTIKLRLDFYSYGMLGESLEKFTVHEITEDSLSYYRPYYYNSTIGYNPSPLGEVSCLVNTDSLSENSRLDLTTADTILFTGRLSDAFGIKLFSQAFVDIDTVNTFADFAYTIKGLAFIPSQSNMVVGINSTSVSEVTIHYHTADEDSLVRSYRIGYNGGAVAFNNITTTRSGDLAAITQPYESYTPGSGLNYLQNGSPVITKVDISDFYSFITGSHDGVNDSLTNIEINSAEISCKIETPPSGMPPPSDLFLRVMNSDDLYLNNGRDADSTFMSGFYAFSGPVGAVQKNFGAYYYPGNDSSRDWILLSYNSSTNSYIGFASLFFQNLFAKKEADRKKGIENPNQIHYLGVVPYAPSPGKTVNRAVIDQNSFKLKITYTTPKVTNQ